MKPGAKKNRGKGAIISPPSGKVTIYMLENAARHPNTVICLVTRVQMPDKQDNKKKTKLMQYQHVTWELSLTIKPSEHPHWWVHSLYSDHKDMKSHSGIFTSLEKGLHTQHEANRSSKPGLYRS